MNIENGVGSLQGQSFHDLPVSGINLKTAGELAFVIEYEQYDEEQRGYIPREIHFQDLISLDATALSLMTAPDLELYSLDFQQEENIEISLRFLTGFGAPSWEVKLVCRNVYMV